MMYRVESAFECLQVIIMFHIRFNLPQESKRLPAEGTLVSLADGMRDAQNFFLDICQYLILAHDVQRGTYQFLGLMAQFGLQVLLFQRINLPVLQSAFFLELLFCLYSSSSFCISSCFRPATIRRYI